MFLFLIYCFWGGCAILQAHSTWIYSEAQLSSTSSWAILTSLLVFLTAHQWGWFLLSLADQEKLNIERVHLISAQNTTASSPLTKTTQQETLCVSGRETSLQTTLYWTHQSWFAGFFFTVPTTLTKSAKEAELNSLCGMNRLVASGIWLYLPQCEQSTLAVKLQRRLSCMQSLLGQTWLLWHLYLIHLLSLEILLILEAQSTKGFHYILVSVFP